MARSNTANTANWFSRASASGLTANPITMSCWFYPFNLTSTSCLMAVGDAAASSYHALLFDGANAYAAGDNKIIIDNSSSFGSSSGAVANANEWNHAASVNASTTSRIAYLNGVAGTTNTGASAATSYNHIDVGAIRSTTTTFNPLDGRIAEVAFWSAALTQDEVTMLSKGVSPLMVRPNSLNRYWPLIRGGSGEIDRILREQLVQNGTMGQAEHVRQFYPAGPFIGVPSSGGGAINGVLAATIAPVTLVSTGTLPINGSLAQTIPAVILSSTGQLIINGAVSQTIPAVTLAATGSLLIQGSLAATIAAFTLNATGTLKIAGALAQTIPPVTLSSTGTLLIQGTFGATIPPVTLVATGTLPPAINNGVMLGTIGPVTLSATGIGAGNSNLGGFAYTVMYRRRYRR